MEEASTAASGLTADRNHDEIDERILDLLATRIVQAREVNLKLGG